MNPFPSSASSAPSADNTPARIMNRWITALAVALALSPVASFAQEAGLIGHWEFSPDRTQNSGMRAVSGKEVSFSGGPRVVKDPPPARVELAGRDESIVIASGIDKTLLPATEMTAEAWVRVDKTSQWGGLVGALQDNGEFERGWLLGFVNSNFSLGLATEKAGRMTYLASTKPFETNHWYHVAGTYDGTEMRVFVNGELTATSREQSGPIFYPPSAPFVIGSYKDDDERYPLTGAIHDVRVYRRALKSEEIAAHYNAKKSIFPKPAPAPRFFKPTFGPFVDWSDRRTAVVTWETESAQPTRLTLELPGGTLRQLGDQQSRTSHSVTLDNLEPDLEHHYRLVAPDEDGRPVVSRRYQFDTSFYYQPARLTAPTKPSTPAATAQAIASLGARDGYSLLFGATDGQLAAELARQISADIVVVEPDAARIPNLRAALTESGAQGMRASVHHIPGAQLPYGDLIANLIVLTGQKPPAIPATELHRVLRPSGGTFAVVGTDIDLPAYRQWLEGSPLAEAKPGPNPQVALAFIRGKLPGGGEWGHQYGGPDNSSCSQDELVKGDLQVAWWGDPGPRPMPDRGNRNPAPLSVNGRLFIQGNRILFGLDAYNGAILWNWSSPEVRRANVTRDCSNMAASGDTLYLAHNKFCIAVDGQTGSRARRFEVPRSGANGPRDWSYVAAGRDLLIGSRVKPEGSYLGDDGEWYEEYAPDQVSRVTSDLLFALDPANGKPLWEYKGGAVLNSTITIGDGMIFFIESRNPAAVQSATCRIQNELLTDQHLVCLDQRTGKRLWEKDHDFSSLQFMTYLVYGKNTVVVTGTDRNKHFHTTAFNAPSQKQPSGSGDDIAAAIGGRVLWTESHKEDKGHHSGHLQHPVVIGDVFYSDQRSFNLTTGETLRKDLPERRGCGVMSAGKDAIFFRHHFHGMWDLATDKRSQFMGIRSGCWLSMIPAGGLLLAPETSAGCSCTHSIQTSIGYIPKVR
jgi:outer membrane protein assembly factor BamB